jgi:hypothetical protein
MNESWNAFGRGKEQGCVALVVRERKELTYPVLSVQGIEDPEIVLDEASH